MKMFMNGIMSCKIFGVVGLEKAGESWPFVFHQASLPSKGGFSESSKTEELYKVSEFKTPPLEGLGEAKNLIATMRLFLSKIFFPLYPYEYNEGTRHIYPGFA